MAANCTPSWTSKHCSDDCYSNPSSIYQAPRKWAANLFGTRSAVTLLLSPAWQVEQAAVVGLLLAGTTFLLHQFIRLASFLYLSDLLSWCQMDANTTSRGTGKVLSKEGDEVNAIPLRRCDDQKEAFSGFRMCGDWPFLLLIAAFTSKSGCQNCTRLTLSQ